MDGGTPSLQAAWGTPSHQAAWRYPPLFSWMGVPCPPPPWRQGSTASTCYASGDMPLVQACCDSARLISIYCQFGKASVDKLPRRIFQIYKVTDILVNQLIFLSFITLRSVRCITSLYYTTSPTSSNINMYLDFF